MYRHCIGRVCEEGRRRRERRRGPEEEGEAGGTRRRSCESRGGYDWHYIFVCVCVCARVYAEYTEPPGRLAVAEVAVL